MFNFPGANHGHENWVEVKLFLPPHGDWRVFLDLNFEPFVLILLKI